MALVQATVLSPFLLKAAAFGPRFLRTMPASTKNISPLAKIYSSASLSRSLGNMIPYKYVCRCKTHMNSAETIQKEPRNQRVLQIALWVLLGVYVWWLFLLPYAPGDPVWAIKPSTIEIVLNLSNNFFFIVPIANAVGFHLLEAPVVPPTAEGLFNFVMGWTVMFAPLLFTDYKKEKFRGSLELLWVAQMFLTNTFLIPYMAIRLGEIDESCSSNNQSTTSKFQSVSVSGSAIVGLIGFTVGLISVLWALYGRPGAGFGDVVDRWNSFVEYITTDRAAYAFIWDIVLYSIFQPWLIGDNLQNVENSKVQIVRGFRFIPYLGLVAYLWGLRKES